MSQFRALNDFALYLNDFALYQAADLHITERE